MAGSSIKIGVDVTEFKRGMTEAQASVKSLDAQLKVNEKSMQAYGKSESYVSTQANILNLKLKEQEKIVQNAEKSLKAMEQNGVSRSSKAYQDMQRRMLEARSAMIDTEVELNNLTTGEAQAAKGADQLANSVGSIGKKISLDQVIGGIDKITNGLENAAKKALDFEKALIKGITGSAEEADNIATQALNLGMDVEDYQRYAKVFETVGEITVQEWRKAKQKVQKAINDPTQEQTDILTILGIQTHASSGGKYEMVQGAARNFEEVFWEIGETLRAKVASGELTQDMADVYANAIFGKGFDQLNPLFTLGQEGFTAALEEQQVATEESVQKLAALNDQLIKLQGDFDTLKMEILASLAPALQEGAKLLDSLLGKINEYLQSEAGQAALQQLGDAVSGLFADMSKIDPEKVVKGFVDVFTKVTDGIKWLVDNKETAKGILGAVVGAWGTLKLGESVLNIVKLVDGIKSLTGIGAAEGAASGASWGGAFASAVIKAAPWLIGLITMLNPAGSQDDSSFNAAGDLTNEGYYSFIEQSMSSPEYKGFLMELGTYFGTEGLRSLLGNGSAVSAIWQYLLGGKAGYNTQGFVNNVLSGFTGLTFDNNWLGVEFNEEELNAILQEIQPAITPTIIIPDDTAQTISEEIGTVDVPANLVFQRNRMTGDWMGAAPDGSNANGLPWVPFDGYMSILHRGERVLTARENKYYTYNNNTYFGNVNLHNGLEVEALTKSIARNNARKNSGYGT